MALGNRFPALLAVRRSPLAARVAAVAVAVAVVAAGAPARAEAPEAHYPWAKRIAAAKRFADARAGRVSFAVVDESGRMRGSHPDRVHNSASVVKVLFMVALLRQKDVRDDALTGARARICSEPMIKRSDNAAATADLQPGRRAGAVPGSPTTQGSTTSATQPTWGLTTITAG